MSLLEVRNLAVEFPSRRGTIKVLDDVSFEISAGEVLGVAGDLGARKSLVSALISGRLDPPGRITGGRILLEGHRIDDFRYEQLQEIRSHRIGFIFQDPLSSLNPLRTVGQQLIDMITMHLPVNSLEARERAIALLREAGISAAEKSIDQYPHKFSPILRQCVAVALILAAEPKLIVLDESAIALCTSVRAQVIHLLKSLCKIRGVGIMLITNDMRVISENCDRVALMYAGRLADIGTVSDVIDREVPHCITGFATGTLNVLNLHP